MKCAQVMPTAYPGIGRLGPAGSRGLGENRLATAAEAGGSPQGPGRTSVRARRIELPAVGRERTPRQITPRCSRTVIAVFDSGCR